MSCRQWFFWLVLAGLLLPSSALFPQKQEDPCPLSDSKKARKLYNEAIEKARSNKNEARALLKEALETDPDFGRAYYVMADLLIRGQKAAEAEPYLKKAAELCPDLDPMVFYRLGSISFGDKRYEEAREYLQRFTQSGTQKEKELDEAREMLKSSLFYIEGRAHPVPFNPHTLTDVSTEADEYLPIITPDNQTIYFTRRTSEFVVEGALGRQQKDIERFSSGESTSDHSFQTGTPLPLPFNKNFNEGGASLSADNKYMFFTICRNEAGTLNCDIWYSVFLNGKWSEITNAGPKINGKTSWESQPSLSSDGKTLYFASNREGGHGGIDIWKSTRDTEGNWSLPENLGPVINTAGNEKSPFFHSDGQTLYFSSTGHTGYGGYDIYFSKLNKDGTWQPPKNIGYPINSDMDDLGFFVSTDGRKGYFASDKLKGVGGWDIYSFDLYKEARPERVLFLKGELKDENNNIVTDARVEIKNVKTEEVTTVEVDSLTGKYVAVMAFNDDHILTVKQPGKAFTSQYLSTADSSLDRPKQLDIEIKEIKVGQSYRINNINFATNSYEVTEQTSIIVRELALFLTENPGVKIAIHGHTDNVGDPKDNLILSQNRAKTVYDQLVQASIAASRLSYKGFGATRPVAGNNTEAGRAQNRRTEFVVVAK